MCDYSLVFSIICIRIFEVNACHFGGGDEEGVDDQKALAIGNRLAACEWVGQVACKVASSGKALLGHHQEGGCRKGEVQRLTSIGIRAMPTICEFFSFFLAALCKCLGEP